MATVGDPLDIDGGIVAGYDGSEPADVALRWAVEEARLRGLDLHVVRAWRLALALGEVDHPYGAVPSEAEIEQQLRAATDRAVAACDCADLPVRTHLVHSSTARALIGASTSADLLVLGHRGAGGFLGLRLGSSAEQVVRHAACTVVVVRRRGEAPPA